MTQRDRIFVTLLAAVAVIAGFWIAILGPKRKEAVRLGTQLTEQRSKIDDANNTLAQYQAAKGQYRKDYATIARLGKAIPTTDDVPSLVYQIESSANRSAVDFRAVKVSGNSAPASTAPAAPATQAAAATLPPGAAIGAAGFPTMPFTFTFDGNFFRLSNFFARLEHYIVATRQTLRVTGRLLTVDGISLKAAPQGFPRMRASVAATAYLLPVDEGLTNGATPTAPQGATPAGSGSATPASGSSPTPSPATATSPLR